MDQVTGIQLITAFSGALLGFVLLFLTVWLEEHVLSSELFEERLIELSASSEDPEVMDVSVSPALGLGANIEHGESLVKAPTESLVPVLGE